MRSTLTTAANGFLRTFKNGFANKNFFASNAATFIALTVNLRLSGLSRSTEAIFANASVAARHEYMIDMQSTSKLEIASWAINNLPQLVKSKGQYFPANPRQPAHWYLDMDEISIALTTGTLQLPDDLASSRMLDVWYQPAGASRRGSKVLSLSWHPSKPWSPPVITRFQAGEWMSRLEEFVAAFKLASAV